MSGEVRLVIAALKWGLIAAAPISGVAYLARGMEGSTSALIALGIVLANAGIAAGLSGLAGRAGATMPAMISIPSFGMRMLAVFGAMAWLKGRSFIDQPTFALTFGFAVFAVIVLESLQWKRTPWIALTLKEKA